MAYYSFDSTQVAPAEEFSVLPAGTYHAIITESDVKPTKAGTGQRMNLTFRITDGPCANRVVFAGLNVANENPKAEEIGQRELSSLCHAVGVLKLQDTSQLHNIPVAIRVSIRKDDIGQYPDRNEIKAFMAIPSHAPHAAPGAFSPAPQATSKPAAPQASAAPWAANRAA
jgi:hypothetical protein